MYESLHVAVNMTCYEIVIHNHTLRNCVLLYLV